MTKNKHIGSRLDDFLKEKGILEEVELAAIKMVIAEQVTKGVKKNVQPWCLSRISR